MAHIALNRRDRPRALISLVPMIDVMLILLVFFMVTSTYLDLDMVPAAERAEDPPSQTTPTAEAGGALPVRIGADGRVFVRGQGLSLEAFGQLVQETIAEAPATNLLILPSGAAPMQALINVMDRATQAGATRLRVIRLEARP